MSEAVKLRTELGNLIKSTESYFISQYQKPVNNVLQPTRDETVETFSKRALYHYQSEIYGYIKVNQASAGLKLMDGLHILQDEVTALFDR